MNIQTIKSRNILHVEAVAMLEAVRTTVTLDLKKIIIKGDNLTIINILEMKNIMGDTDIHCKHQSLLQQFSEIRIVHCYREANLAAYFLATKNCNPSTIMSSLNYT